MSPWRSAAITLLATIAGASVGAAASLALSAGSLGFATASVPQVHECGIDGHADPHREHGDERHREHVAAGMRRSNHGGDRR